MSAETTKVYDVVEVTCNLGGIPLDQLGGWGEGDETMSVERDSEAFTDKVGADGSVTRSPTHDNRATVTLNLMQTAGANAVLSTLVTGDMNAPNGAGVVPFMLRDRQGLSLVTATKAWLLGPPKKLTFGPQAGNNQWKIRLADSTIFAGGN